MVLLKISPSAVHAGWLALVIILALGAVVALLVWSMRRQMRKIRLPRRDEIQQQEAENAEAFDAEPDADGSGGRHAEEGHQAGPRA
jgi:flagellar biosynthesis/type III secretory pathway M-ring protein FliF/YscJ